MQNPLVSILTPFKNTENFLDECLKSIVNQTYKNWELIIVDDHSTDSSYKIVEQYLKTENRIKLLKNSGSGIIEALRLALKNSKGEYITRMDSDDIMTPNKIEKLVNNLQKHGKKHIAIGQVKYFSKEGISNGYQKYEIWLNKLTSTGKNYSEIYKECVIPSPCWMIHAEDLINCNAFNPNDYPEDYDLTFRFYKANYKCIACNEVLHLWRDYQNRTSRTHEHYAQNYFLDIKMRYFIELDYNANKTLVVWGAGYKGKFVARTLVKNNIPFVWICNNLNKIGHTIFDQTLKPFEYLETIQNPQSIITVANKESQQTIKNYMSSLNKNTNKDYYFFC